MECENAVSLSVSYILLSGISLIFFTTILLTSNDILITGPTNIVIEEQYGDIGNMISTKIMYMYLIAPENGLIETDYRIPTQVGKETYMIKTDLAESDGILEIQSENSDKNVRVTMNGIASSMPITGIAYSSESSHRISYDSER
jgi:hypothetical protein